MTKRHILCILAGAALLGTAGMLLLLHTPDTTDNVVLYPDAYSREYYLNLCGWQVTLLQEDTVTIPRQFNTVYYSGIFGDFSRMGVLHRLALDARCAL